MPLDRSKPQCDGNIHLECGRNSTCRFLEFKAEILVNLSKKVIAKSPTVGEWHDKLLRAIEAAIYPSSVFSAIDEASHQLGFEHCGIALFDALPVTRAPLRQFSSQPLAWQLRYAQAGYIRIDPTILHASRSEAPVIWSDRLFAQAPQLRRESQAAGLQHGCTQSSLDLVGVGCIVSLTRSAEPITESELQRKQADMRFLVEVARIALGREQAHPSNISNTVLTDREKEVLRLTADGKTADEIAATFNVSANTINFHLKNCATKLQTTNKTSLVVHALLRHLLD